MNVTDYTIIAALAGNGGGSPTPTPAEGGGFDFVIKCDNTTSELIFSLDSGDFDKVVQKIQNFSCLTGYCFAFDTVNERISQNMIFRSARYSEDDDFIVTTWSTLDSPQNIYINWERDGTVYED